jgi:GTP-binding protein
VLNFFKINDTLYFVDLPGYGYARTKTEEIGLKLNQLIEWYLFQYSEKPTIILIIDAEVGPTANDIGIFQLLRKKKREIIIVANKVDKIRKSLYDGQIANIQSQFPATLVIPYSSKKHIGTQELLREIFMRKKKAGKIIREKYSA